MTDAVGVRACYSLLDALHPRLSSQPARYWMSLAYAVEVLPKECARQLFQNQNQEAQETHEQQQPNELTLEDYIDLRSISEEVGDRLSSLSTDALLQKSLAAAIILSDADETVEATPGRRVSSVFGRFF
ncbi:MAG: hypothetical protein MHM6MM_006831 [Cercozoa sp. M6MM]